MSPLKNRSIVLAVSAVTAAVFYICTVPAGSVELGPDFRKVPSPETYGAVKMNKTGKAAQFNHITHRGRYSCRVCHTEVGFPFKADSIEIKHAEMDAGKYCAACHNGKDAFSSAGDCEKCHNAGSEPSTKLLGALKGLPQDYFGNQVNWVEAEKQGLIRPMTSIKGTKDHKVLDTEIVIPAAKFKPSPPDVIFKHKPHTGLLDCASCHPDLFKAKRGANADMSMIKIISGQYCGTCHGKVSFPLNDCFRCHSSAVAPMEDVKIDIDEGKSSGGK